MKYIEYEYCLIYSVPDEEQRQLAEQEIRKNCISGSHMDPILDFNYDLQEDEKADKHFTTGKELADYVFGLYVDMWSW